MINGQEPDDDRLSELVSFILEKSRQLGDLRTAFQCLKGVTRELERDISQEHVVIGKGVMVTNLKRVSLD